jgi:uncharacterized protein (DUF697 family)
MNRKTLPNVIVRKSEDKQRGKITGDTAKRQKRSDPSSTPNSQRDEAPVPSATLPQRVTGSAPSPEILSAPLAEASPSDESRHAEPQKTQRRAQAEKIVDRHKVYAAMGGLFPVPIINIAGLTAINARMVKALSKLYGVPFERDRTRSIIMGLLGGAVPSGLAIATTSTLAFIIPASGIVGLAASSLSAAALTRGLGLVFVEHFESGAV